MKPGTKASARAVALAAIVAFGAATAIPLTVSAAGPETDGQALPELGQFRGAFERPDPHTPMMQHDAATAGIVSDGPFADVIKNLAVAGRGERRQADATTDVWTLDGFAYIGTFNSPCGGEPDAGVFILDVHNVHKPTRAGFIPSPTGSRSNDVKAANINSGRILLHPNEACAGGPGGFEIYNVDDPTNPTHLAHVQTDDVNALLRDELGFVDFGVHNLFLFTQGDRDYVSAVAESEFGNFQIFDITEPTSPKLVGFWGAESNSMGDYPAPHPFEDYATLTDFDKILDADAYLFGGFGACQNRFLYDITISADGNHAYLGIWDADLILLDLSDPTIPVQVSVALDVTSEDGEVNSHSAWPSEDGTIYNAFIAGDQRSVTGPSFALKCTDDNPCTAYSRELPARNVAPGASQ